MDLLSTGYAAANDGLKDTSYEFIENIITEMTLKGTFDDLFLQNLERWSEKPTFMNAFTKRVLNSRMFTSPLATFIKEKIDNSVEEWSLAAKEEAHYKRKKMDPTTPPAPPTTSSSDEFQPPVKLNRGHTREHKHKSSKVPSTIMYPPFRPALARRRSATQTPICLRIAWIDVQPNVTHWRTLQNQSSQSNRR